MTNLLRARVNKKCLARRVCRNGEDQGKKKAVSPTDRLPFEGGSLPRSGLVQQCNQRKISVISPYRRPLFSTYCDIEGVNMENSFHLLFLPLAFSTYYDIKGQTRKACHFISFFM
jgi:hypothetical protein